MSLGRAPRRRTGRAGGVLWALDLLLMFIRVAIVTTLWLGLFLGAMFGYLTAPFVVLIVFIAVYAVVDRYRVRRRLEDERRRRILGEPLPGPILETGERA